MGERWIVHKFGGTSVKSAERYRNAADILREYIAASPIGVVVSAMKGVTDDLLSAVSQAAAQDASWTASLEKIAERHRKEIGDLLRSPRKEQLLEVIEKDFQELHEIIRGAWILKEATEIYWPVFRAWVKFGRRRFSAPICRILESMPSGWMRAPFSSSRICSHGWWWSGKVARASEAMADSASESDSGHHRLCCTDRGGDGHHARPERQRLFRFDIWSLVGGAGAFDLDRRGWRAFR